MSKSPRTSLTASLAADAVSLFRSWWHKDRIRSSPREGKLLRLAEGAILCIAGTTVEVVRRDVIETDEGPVVRYRCRDIDADAELRVRLQSIMTIAWYREGDVVDLIADEIEIWSEGKRGSKI